MPPKRISKPSVSGKKLQKQSKTTKNATDEPKKNEKPTSKAGTSKDSGETKMTLCTIPTMSSRPTRRPGRPPSAKSSMGISRPRDMSAKVRSTYRRSLDPCDNSNDSGIGFDHHMDSHHHIMGMSERLTWTGERAEAKRPKMDIKLEHDDVNDGYCFPEAARSCKDNISLIRTAPAGSVPSLSIANNQSSSSGRAVPRCIPLSSRQSSSAPVSLTAQLLSSSRYMDVSLMIVKQPEQQHRARYQTEGSRGAVKDREGNGFPIVQLSGYHKPTTLQVFIGTDIGKVSPHMFYQACKVSGKNSTPCLEKKIDGTCVIELQLDPSKEMSATCDCVGILKERNVDVEHRFPDQLGNRSKKKSTRCRMIFRTTITLDNGTQETLQACSQPIVCTQPPGVPEICKKSLTSCPASGGLELFVLGKNFLKDTKVYFQLFEEGHLLWEKAVVPDKEYLQQTHFVCVIPPYRTPDITEPVSVRLCVVSSGKTSEPHQFVYTPVNGAMPSVHIDPSPPAQPAQFFKGNFWNSAGVTKRDQDLDMMPPPESSLVPMATRRPSLSLPSTSEIHSPPIQTLKQEYIDENSQGSIADHERYRHLSESSLDVHHGDSNVSMINENSMDMIHQNSLGHMNENSNISVGNEDSIDVMVRRNSIGRCEDSVDAIIRRNSMSRPISSACESSLDCPGSNMSIINENSSCSTPLRRSNSVNERQSLSQHIHSASLLASSGSATAVEKVIDLRMKMPMATVADLINTTAPSMAALHGFGMEHTNGPLPTQSAQSVENYLTKIESKPSLLTISNSTNMLMKSDLNEKLTQMLNAEQSVFQAQKVLNSQIITGQNCGMLSTTTESLSHLGATTALTGPEPVYLSSSRPFLSSTTQNEAINIVAKSEAADIAEQTLPEQTTAMSSSVITTMATSLERSVPTPINTEKLDALVNSTVESHLSPRKNDTAPKDVLITNNMPLVTTNSNPSEVMIASQDVMLNSHSNLLVPPTINTRMPSPVLGQQEISNSHAAPNLPAEVILNSQISPSLMCRSTSSLQQDALLPSPNLNICSTTNSVESSLLPSQQTINTSQTSAESLNSLHSPISVNLATEPEKAVIFKAAVDFLETQKKISELGTNSAKCDIMMTSRSPHSLSQLQDNPGNNFVQPQFADTCTNLNSPVAHKEQKSEFVIPIPVKEITTTQNDKKNEDRMIPQSFTSLTENELINLINPSCFDQV
ncbi:nuclear factor of activated T-cells 5 isoform X2 [Anoplophora glabripennis]|uniref:nuclear factor of activated T-cells 5 isoform X2 n=1 Tax=Anoplophora glabripennis TaxID=217634 RepID=UPI0008755E5D|nr:nuclear factor of activated T-cells 5 isoform X2 [Anoplophora glabripennis]